eukprot:3302226-Amphidinium_carterae.2
MSSSTRRVVQRLKVVVFAYRCRLIAVLVWEAQGHVEVECQLMVYLLCQLLEDRHCQDLEEDVVVYC